MQHSCRKPNIYINGRFLQRRVTGVERFGIGVIHALDMLLAESETLSSRYNFIVVVPRSLHPPPGFKRLTCVHAGPLNGHMWEQTTLAWVTRDGLLINLCNSGPVVRKNMLTVIHDAAVYRFPQYFSKTYGRVHRALGRLIARRSHLATVSEFSRKELSKFLSAPAAEISVIRNACDHLGAVRLSAEQLEEFGVKPRGYFIVVGSQKPNKNLRKLADAYRLVAAPKPKLVIVGAADHAVFGGSDKISSDENIVSAGYLDDNTMAGLIAQARALVFPSLYEGFGIPPLEAMILGCPVVASDIDPVREVCGENATYFDPHSIDQIRLALERLATSSFDQEMVEKARRHSLEFSWETSASAMLRRIEEITK